MPPACLFDASVDEPNRSTPRPLAKRVENAQCTVEHYRKPDCSVASTAGLFKEPTVHARVRREWRYAEPVPEPISLDTGRPCNGTDRQPPPYHSNNMGGAGAHNTPRCTVHT